MSFPPGFIPRGNRWMNLIAEVDMGNVEHVLEHRLPELFRDFLYDTIGPVAGRMIDTAKGQLYPHHGVRTGKLKATLDAFLVEAAFESFSGVFFDLESHDAPYWVWVEFGHMRNDGSWWPGYHFLENAVREHEKELMVAIQQAWKMTTDMLGAESKGVSMSVRGFRFRTGFGS